MLRVVARSDAAAADVAINLRRDVRGSSDGQKSHDSLVERVCFIGRCLIINPPFACLN